MLRRDRFHLLGPPCFTDLLPWLHFHRVLSDRLFLQVLQHQLWDVHEATILSLGGEVGFAPSPSIKSGRPSHLQSANLSVSNDSRIWRPINESNDGGKTIQAHPGPSSSLHDEKLCLPGSLQSDMERRLADVKRDELNASAVLSDSFAFSPRSKMSTKLVKQARQVSERIEDQIDGDAWLLCPGSKFLSWEWKGHSTSFYIIFTNIKSRKEVLGRVLEGVAVVLPDGGCPRQVYL